MISPFDLNREELRIYGLPHITDVTPKVHLDILLPLLVNLRNSYADDFSHETLSTASINEAICYYLSYRYQIAIEARFSTSKTYSTKEYFKCITQSILNQIDPHLLISHIDWVKCSDVFHFNNFEINKTQPTSEQIEHLAIRVMNKFYQINSELDEFQMLLEKLRLLNLRLKDEELIDSITNWIDNFNQMKVANKFSSSKTLSLLRLTKELRTPVQVKIKDCYFIEQSRNLYRSSFMKSDLEKSIDNILLTLGNASDRGLCTNNNDNDDTDDLLLKVQMLTSLGKLTQNKVNYDTCVRYKNPSVVDEDTSRPLHHETDDLDKINSLFNKQFRTESEWEEIIDDLDEIQDYFNYFVDDYTFNLISVAIDELKLEINQDQEVSLS